MSRDFYPDTSSTETEQESITHNLKLEEKVKILSKELESTDLQQQSEIKEHHDIEEEIRSKSFILDKSTDALIVMNFQGRILYINDSAYRFLGLNSGYGIDVASEPFNELIPQIIANKNHIFEIQVTGKNGECFDLEINSHFDSLNGQSVIVSILRDISERKKIEQTIVHNETIIKALLNAAPESAFLFDNQGYLLTLNENAVIRLGTIPEQWINRHITQLFSKEVSLHRMKRIQEVVDTKKSVRFQDVRNGLYFENTIAPILNPDGNVYMVALFAHEITEHKLAQAQILKQKEELERSNKELEQFAYVASHDLQEPLRKITSFITLLERRYKGHLDETADRYIYYVVDGAMRMQGLINDLLTYSRVGRQDKEQTIFDCNVVLSHILRDLEPMIIENDARISVQELPEIYGNPVQMRQLLMNLISNAIKFRRPESPIIDIRCELSETEWIFSVRDNGIGIDHEYSERIFEMFQRLHTKEEYAGTGIGLAICKKIVEINGGRIWFESQPGFETVFYFSWPIKGGG